LNCRYRCSHPSH